MGSTEVSFSVSWNGCPIDSSHRATCIWMRLGSHDRTGLKTQLWSITQTRQTSTDTCVRVPVSSWPFPSMAQLAAPPLGLEISG